ncbi:hydrogenase nickel incorporation protein HypB [Aliiglaciecola sp. CAU 1673]|uniref:hydrogenase nickel incorporation protein HypB n=1 Tax=Aliiglaciecola sp. CAU 1673 TaxID=3032595 RepID=UPI0023DCE53D|nr:hydrogenase nickel incorporation protein HypB [Aliiglaciecola sp. CAU 1673]MDF2180190.1 hydrogenase nickel incorporation protein HypB [Aliiglaciecola sp. CAU 1673]
MCRDCGCGGGKYGVSPLKGAAPLDVGEKPAHLALHVPLLAANDKQAEQNRQWLNERGILCINLMGTPGAGKTQLLQSTCERGVFADLAILEGDQQTDNDAIRIAQSGGRAVQINTGSGCHLDAEMIEEGLAALCPKDNSLLIIENVGNLVCPALFDIGEHARVAMMAVTDGEDKPQKYPHMFSQCDLIVLNKVDLLPYVDFDVDRFKTELKRLNPRGELIQLSAKSGEGIGTWLNWLTTRRQRDTALLA